MRKVTKEVTIGNRRIGGDNSILVQSMCNTKTDDIESTVKQIKLLEEAGCEIIRVAVPDMESAKALKEIKKEMNVPLVADIHFDYKLALESARYVDKLRINPGNIGDRTKQVIEAAKENGIGIRIGINLGSLEKQFVDEYGYTAKAMVESAFRHIRMLEKEDFRDIIVSLKASDIFRTVEAYKLFSSKSDYPLHLGITEAGTKHAGTIKSSIGIGGLLYLGIGDTIRVSLTADPVEEVKAGFEILKALELRREGRILISCPTCGRTHGDMIKIAKEIEERTKSIKKGVKIAVMGCEVNGPGEAREADIGIALCKEGGVLFKKGEMIRKISKDRLVEEFIEEVEKV